MRPHLWVQVGADGAVEQDRLLRHHRHGAAQLGQRQLAHIHTIQRQLACGCGGHEVTTGSARGDGQPMWMQVYCMYCTSLSMYKPVISPSKMQRGGCTRCRRMQAAGTNPLTCQDGYLARQRQHGRALAAA